MSFYSPPKTACRASLFSRWHTRLGAALAIGLSYLALQAGTFVQFRTVFGDLEVELYDQDKPVTTQNFIRYIQSGRYDGQIVHRVSPGFVVQGGGYYLNRTNNSLYNVSTFGNITNEYSVGRTFSNLKGTISMARVGGDTNSANSQWFLNIKDNAFLDSVDGGFTVFGHVVGGTNVMDAFLGFKTAATTNGVWDVRSALGDGALNEFPLLRPQLNLSYLVYVDISLLNVKVAPVAQGRQISWTSVSNRVNRVEYTTVFPPQWQTLADQTGTGGALQVTDSAAAGYRFYRVRVVY